MPQIRASDTILHVILNTINGVVVCSLTISSLGENCITKLIICIIKVEGAKANIPSKTYQHSINASQSPTQFGPTNAMDTIISYY